MSYLVKEKTRQTYSYDNLYQLIKVEGETIYNPYRSTVPEFVSNYSQDFTFDELGLGNMTSKVSKESVRPNKKIGDNLNYNFTYVYDENYVHRLVRAGDRYYKYDLNGNIICEQDGSFESNENDTAYHKIEQETDGVYSTDYGWGLFKEDKTGSTTSRYRRTYAWNERNQLISSVDANYSTAYVYGQDGQRSNKYTGNSETLYFNKMWTHHTDSGNSIYGGQTSKNIYLGETRIVTKLNSGEEPTYQEEYYKQYYYHSDHLGSASLISDYKGDEYQRIEYTPYGETWVEKTQNTGLEYLPYKFTAKELDEETGLYYYGARYLNPKYSMWISCDPALGEYIPQGPINDEIRKNNQNLPGMGGIFNHINSNLYHYAGNNPIRYTDPDGEMINLAAGAIAFVGGAAIGALVNYGTQVSNNLRKGKGWSSLSEVDGNEIIASAAGSGTAGFVLATTANPVLAGTAGGAVSNVVGQTLDGKFSKDFDCLSFILDTAIGGLCGAALSGFKIQGVTIGKGSMLSVAKQMIKKLGNGTIKHITTRTALKCALSTSIKGALARGDLAANIFDDIYDETGIKFTINDIEKAIEELVNYVGQEMEWEN